MYESVTKFNNWCMYDASPDRYRIPSRYVINFFKAGMLPSCILMMIYFNNYSINSTLYAALHGSYGVIWLLKDLTFGDKGFAIPSTLTSNLIISVLLIFYHSIAFLTIQNQSLQLSLIRIFVAVFIYAIGIFLMIGSDAQKYFTLECKKGLVTTGFCKYTRNPNYLGEIMIYLSFAIICQNMFVYAVLVFVWVGLFGMRMAVKDYSLSKKPEFADYKKNSYLLFPKLFEKNSNNMIFYSISVAALVGGYFVCK